jgi:sugar phosphate permease
VREVIEASSPVQVHDVGRRRAWAVWGAALSVYVLAVFHRTSLGVAGIIAADRFHISASQLATFTVVQLAVYAAMQIPVGVLLDRFGSRRLLLTGLLSMTVGQAYFALAGSFGAGLAARVLIGLGDAMIFTSVLRLVALWFRPTQAPVVTQLTGQIGQLGAVVAAFPLSVALRHLGWGAAYGISAGAGVLLSALLVLVVKDSPFRGTVVERIRVRTLRRNLSDVWGSPGTRLGLWSHFTSQFGITVFSLLWGYPFLVAGEGLSPDTASALLIAMTATTLVAGPVLGRVVTRVPFHRSHIVLGIVAAIAGVWAVVLLWPGRAPLPLLVVLVMVTAIGGPTSMVGFDLARTFHPPERIGSALGVVNVGGFVASLTTMALIGVALDRLAPGGPSAYTLDDFRVAMAVQYLVWGLGAVQVWRYRRKAIRHLARAHPETLAALRRGDPVSVHG